MKTKAAAAFAPGQALELIELDLREPGPGEDRSDGHLHSDLAVLDGQASRIGRFPIVVGHKGAGVSSALARVSPPSGRAITWC